jgi:predicted secreted protein
MPRAGYQVTIRRAGAPTSGTLALTHLGDGLHRVTNAANRVISPNHPWHLMLSGATVAYSDVQSADWLFGYIQTEDLAGVPDLHATYLPLDLSSGAQVVGGVTSHSVSESANLIDITDYNATGEAIRKRIYGLRDATVSLSMNLTTAQSVAVRAIYDAGQDSVFEVNSGFDAVWRGIGKIASCNVASEVDDKVTLEVEWNISSVRDQHVPTIFTGISERVPT